MGRKLTVDLWTDKLYKIKDMQEYLKSFKLDLDIATEETVNELVDFGSRRASLLNSVAPKSGVEDNQVIGDSRHGTISLVGRNAIRCQPYISIGYHLCVSSSDMACIVITTHIGNKLFH